MIVAMLASSCLPYLKAQDRGKDPFDKGSESAVPCAKQVQQPKPWPSSRMQIR